MLKKVFIALVFIAQITPAQAAPNYVFPIAHCAVEYAHVHHNYPATDILTPTGCKFVSPVSGTIDEVNRIDRWNGKTNMGADRGGLYVSVIGIDGVRYYGSHLKSIDPLIQPGLVVNAGQLLGKVGTSGDARGTKSHLHFGISWTTPADTWWVRRGEVYPWKYLDAWKIGKDLSPAKSVAALKVKVGEVPPVPKY
jgi:murein DD-endopeptidase MepM/ murein hydrolase activator NlpD